MINSISYQGKVVSYRITGNGSPLLLIHGFGFNRSVWQPLIPFLEPHFKLIMPDLPGSGGSEVFDDEPSIREMAASVARVLKNEEVEQCPVVGHSMGGYVALAMAAQFDCVNRLCLFHSHPFADDATKKEKRNRDIEFLNKQDVPKYIRQLLQTLFSENFKTTHKEMVEDLIGKSKELDSAGLKFQLAAMRDRADQSKVLAQYGLPVSFVVGVQDPVIPAETVQKMASLPEKATVFHLRDCAHMSMFEQTPVVAEFLIKWIL